MVCRGVSPQIDNLKNRPCNMFPWWMAKLRKGESIHIKDVSKMPAEATAEKKILESQDIKSLLVLPVHIGGALNGFIGLDNVVETGEWGDTDLANLRISSEIIGNALERKKAEEALLQSEELYRTLFENTGTAMIIIEDDTTISHVNEEMETVWGYPKGEIEGRVKWPELVVKEDLERMMNYHRLRRIDPKAAPKSYEFHFLHKQGDVRDASLTAALIPGTKKSVISVKDVTERKRMEDELRQSEALYRTVFKTTGVPTVILDEAGTFYQVNAEGAKISGFTKEELEGKKSWTEFIAKKEDLEMMLEIHRLRRTDHDNAPVNYEFLFKDRYGNLRNIYVTTTIIPGTKRSVVSFMDLTERKRAEEERDRILKELEAKNAALDRFTYTVSHGLRSPLVTIQGFTSMLQNDLERDNKEKAATDLQYITKAATKMDCLLRDTLQLSRIGRIANPPEDVPFGAIVQDALEQTAEQIKSSGVEVSVAEDLPTVHVDRMRIAEVLVNLIGNSIRYRGEQPHPKIDIGCRVEGQETVFFVKDNGIGIDKTEHEKVFELFYRVNARGEGTGAGLAIVKRILEVHGGRIWIESELGKGCTVCFILPVAGEVI